MAGDLDGILVLALEQAVAAPYCSGRLADAGARVIKIERPEGDFARRYDRHVEGQSAYFVWLNRGKQSLVADIKDPGDRALLHRILARADVFIQNLAPGAAERAGFGADALRRLYPRLVACSISGYGETGPYRDMKAYDLLVQAESGLCGVTGAAGEPARVGVSVCDIAAGMYAHQAILQALYARERTGRGRHVRVSLFDAMADWMTVPYLQYRYGGHTPQPAGLHHPTIAPYGAYACRDGTILLSIQNEREWRRLCAEVLGHEALAEDPRFVDNPARVANRPALDRAIAERFAGRPRDEVAAALFAAGIAYGRLSSLDDLRHHPQARFAGVETPGGPVEMFAPPPIADGEAGGLGPVPAVGKHDAAIRAEFAAPAGEEGAA
jgi:crotonobetainyl-CoA:carnitine CoA-transferase CaiB-like acyl-CoA transferase